MTGLAITLRAAHVQKPRSLSAAGFEPLRRNTRSAFTWSPMRPSTAGSNVSEASTATSTTEIAPRASDRKMVRRDDEHAEERQHHRHAAEEHRSAGRRARRLDGVELLLAVTSLLPDTGR